MVIQKLKMKFPIAVNITKASGDYPTAATLQVDGNAGAIPPAFQWSQFTEGGRLLGQGVTPMTDAQWIKWGDRDDAEYITESTAKNLGLEIQQFPEVSLPLVIEIQKSAAKAAREELRILSIAETRVEMVWERVQIFAKTSKEPAREEKVEAGSYMLTRAERAEWADAADPGEKLLEFVAAAIDAKIV